MIGWMTVNLQCKGVTMHSWSSQGDSVMKVYRELLPTDIFVTERAMPCPKSPGRHL